MRLKDNPSACVEPEYRNGRTCRECYFSQVNEKNQWTGSQRCWNAGCIVSDMSEQAIAVTADEEFEMHICKRCGVAYELSIIDKGYGKPRFCPNCGYREMYQ